VIHSIVVKDNRKTPGQKKRKQTPYKWLRDHTSSIDFGKKVFDKKLGKFKPVHCNKNEDVMRRFLYKAYYLDSMRNRDYDAHFSGDTTYYFTGDARRTKPYILLMLDIDCHKWGTLKGAVEFAEYLRTKYFPNLYFEVSTNGNGVHAYLVVEKDRLCAELLNELFGRLQHQLRQLLLTKSFDVQDVEVKGTCPVFKWGEAKGDLLSYQSGQLAKLPRCLDRFEELKNTTCIDAASLLKLPLVPKDEKWGGDVFADSASSYFGCLMRASNCAGLRYSRLECLRSKL